MHRILIHFNKETGKFNFYRSDDDTGKTYEFYPKPPRGEVYSLTEAVEFAYNRSHLADCESVLLTFGESTVKFQEVSDLAKTKNMVKRLERV